MGMHIGLIAAQTTVPLLRDAFLRVWPHYQIHAWADELQDADAVREWWRAHEQFVSAADWSRENPGREVFIFRQDGAWAVLMDSTYVLASDEAALATLSSQFNTVLSFVVETVGGCAYFRCFENGECRRAISNDDGNVAMSGEPLPQEAGINANGYYMEETESLCRAFGIFPYFEDAPPNISYQAISVTDSTDYSDDVNSASGEPSPTPSRQKPWWRLW